MTLRVPPRSAQPIGLSRVSERQLADAGFDLKALFGWQKVAVRQVEEVTPAYIKVDGARLPRSLVAGNVVKDQWLKFSKGADGQVSVAVDLKATLVAEQRLNDLFVRLKT